MTARNKAFGVIALAGALTLGACGTDANKPDGGNGNGGGDSSGTGGTGGGAAAAECFQGNLKAEGSSAQKNAIEKAIADFGKNCDGAQIDYNPTGSGAGIKQFTAQQVDFAGSDSALNPDKGEVDKAKQACGGSEAIDLPMVAGPIAIAYKLDGVDLVLDGETAAKIFSGKITKWDDQAIKKLNPKANLPSKDIKVYFRSDESGTTENFTKYLKAAGKDAWTDKPEKKWTGSVGEGKQKSSGVAQAVQSQDGGITYVEWSYVQQNNLQMAAIQTDPSKEPVKLTGESAGKAVAAAKPREEGSKDLALKLQYDTKADGAYPIVLVTYEIACTKYQDAEKGKKVKSFLKFMADPSTQKSFEEKGYAPLPSEVQSKVASAIDQIS